jgi:hypothetical protein
VPTHYGSLLLAELLELLLLEARGAGATSIAISSSVPIPDGTQSIGKSTCEPGGTAR